ncbi:DUF1360 domain-containing protein [Paraconexibacter antarcticus]|uniref:DUF1360 domain-containing protein n=1 Tax=Paraconexibacter antarcticus TaxID=2949664 RepID=A0ABY5DZ41_9ACTN|nr:DUF1360 domain-containing protein [Paraconexibacter antarcticus]UTI66112.1 DUF1360 domain-containing protein [Paraconexibacter antarcticus]
MPLHLLTPRDVVPLQDRPGYRGHSPGQERALGGYLVLTAVFSAANTAFALWYRRSGRRLPDTVAGRDLALVAVATHKAARIIAKDRVTSAVRAPFTRVQHDAGPGEVEEAARRRGVPRAIGELLVCPYCLGPWIASALTAALLVAPRLTRLVCSVLCAVFAADVLQLAYARAEGGVTGEAGR